jgi:hypothetical protein
LQNTYAASRSGGVDWVGLLNHWKTNGRKEGRNPGTLNCGTQGGAPGLENLVFDPCFYTNKYPDLKRAFGVDWWRAAHHWKTSGIHEGRQSSAGFSIRAYYSRYPDLQRAFGQNWAALLNHWWEHGKKEGRNPRP